MVFSSTNGQITVPTGALHVCRFEAHMRDAMGRSWTARSWMSGRPAIAVTSRAVTRVEWGPPLKASIQTTWSAASESIRLSPRYADRAGNEFSVTVDSREGKPPGFAFLDGEGKVVWRGDFEYG